MSDRVVDEGRGHGEEWRVVQHGLTRGHGPYELQRIYTDADGVKRWSVEPLEPQRVWDAIPAEEPGWRRAQRLQDERDRWIRRRWWRRLFAEVSPVYRMNG